VPPPPPPRGLGQHTIGVRPRNLQIFGYAATSPAARDADGHRSIGRHVYASSVPAIALHISSAGNDSDG